MHRWIFLGPLVLLAACDVDDGDNPLPSGTALDRATKLGQVTMLSEIVKAPPATAVCLLTPYAQEVNHGKPAPLLPELSQMDAFLQEGNSDDLAADGISGLIIASHNGVKMRTYTRWTVDMRESSSTSPLPAGFTELECTRLANAALFRTKEDHNDMDVLVFGSYRP